MKRDKPSTYVIGEPQRLCLGLVVTLAFVASSGWAADPPAEVRTLREVLDAPLLFVKRHSYLGIHIYDTFYKWGPGGGIYIIENPSAPTDQYRIRAVIDPTTPETLGEGIYSDPEISWDAKRLLFCFKSEPHGSTSIYEIGLDGTGLKRLTDPGPCCAAYQGSHGGVHDVSPAYLPDGRIVLTSTRQHGLVPCANEGVNILHVMNADGSGMHSISVNNVNEFDPCVLPDGRILHGRWEYVDKTALTQQSLWTIFADGADETALFANNMVHPEALLDARPIPGASHLIAATMTPHNSPPRGTIGIVDTRVGKNSAAAITNFEYPDDPTYDRGNSCEPWPLSEDVMLFSGRPEGAKYNVIELIDRSGRREVIFSDPNICCHSPMLVKPRQPSNRVMPRSHRREVTGRFFVQDIYQGLAGVERGEVKRLRVIEETSRVSSTPGGAMNQTFLMSGVLAWSAKNFLGTVPVEPDGSAYFEVPSGRAIYLQALDNQGRLVQSMRTFVQASPGVVRSCIGCHEHKFSAPSNEGNRVAIAREPHQLEPESWGSGFIDFPSMVQPILDKHCVSCHGGEKGIEAGLDLTGGWTEYFTISYENLISRRETQVIAHLIAAIDCMNGTSRFSAPIRPPRFHGSGAAPLAQTLVSGHEGRIPDLTREERDLTLAWIDTNGLFHGTWDYTQHGCGIKVWKEIKESLVSEMRSAGCVRCHQSGKQIQFENDWFNLERPELSRILRAPLAKDEAGFGLALCREQTVDPKRGRVRILLTGKYVHRDLPVEEFKAETSPKPNTEGEPVVTFASTNDAHYQTMLAVIRDGRRQALAAPRVDMPGAEVVPGMCRQLISPALPKPLPTLQAHVDSESVVHLSWERSARTIGLSAEVHRGTQAGFEPRSDTLLKDTTLFRLADFNAPQGQQHYALVLCSGTNRSAPIRTSVTVSAPQPPPVPAGLEAVPVPGRVDLRWQEAGDIRVRYHVYRAAAGSNEFERLTAQPTTEIRYSDAQATQGIEHAYAVRAVNRRGIESDPSTAVKAAALPEIKEPLFVAAFTENTDAALLGGDTAKGSVVGKAKITDASLDLSAGGHVTFAHRPEFDLAGRLSIECWVNLAQESPMPVIISCGQWRQAGWFLQRIGRGWRWHVGGIDCDGGKPAPNRWTHLAGTFDGRTTRLFQDGQLVAEKAGSAIHTPWKGPLHIGQYSGGLGPAYQVTGRIKGLRIYSRALPNEAVTNVFQTTGPPNKP